MLPVLPIVGYGVGALVSISIAALHAGRAVVPRLSALPGPTVCFLHPDLRDHLEDVRLAVGFWRALGHDDLSPDEIYLGEMSAGVVGVEIVPAPADMLERRTVALAQVQSNITEDADDAFSDPDGAVEDSHEVQLVHGIISRGTIYLDPMTLVGRDASRVIAHELGHAAYGFGHVTARLGRKNADREHLQLQIPKYGHLMHPQYEDGGWGHEGLEVEALGLSRAELRRAIREARRR